MSYQSRHQKHGKIRVSDNPNSKIRQLYFLYFASFGIIVTYLNIYYVDQGLTGFHIGVLTGVTPLAAVVVSPFWGILSDRFGAGRKLLMLACLGILFAIAGIFLTEIFPLLILFTLIFSIFECSILPILDSAALLNLGDDRSGFGRERVWGSYGYIIAAWGIGFVLQKLGSQWMFLFYGLAILALLISSLSLPSTPIKIEKSLSGNIAGLLKNRNWWFFAASLIALGLGNVSYSSFLGIHIMDLGGQEGIVGTVVAIATITELPIFILSSKLLHRFRPRTLLLTAFAANSLRLFLYGIMPLAWWAVPISLLHSLAFGVYWIAAIAMVDSLAPDEIKSSAQAIFYSVLYISRMLGALACGSLYDHYGGQGVFIISAGVSLLAIIFTLFIQRNQNPETVSEE